MRFAGAAVIGIFPRTPTIHDHDWILKAPSLRSSVRSLSAQCGAWFAIVRSQRLRWSMAEGMANAKGTWRTVRYPHRMREAVGSIVNVSIFALHWIRRNAKSPRLFAAARAGPRGKCRSLVILPTLDYNTSRHCSIICEYAFFRRLAGTLRYPRRKGEQGCLSCLVV